MNVKKAVSGGGPGSPPPSTIEQTTITSNTMDTAPMGEHMGLTRDFTHGGHVHGWTVTVLPTRFSLAEITVLAGGAMPPPHSTGGRTLC